MKETPEFLRVLPRGQKTAACRDVSLFLRKQIETGRLASGETLPSLRELARIWNISYYTIQQATDELMRSGLLCKYPGRGIAVSAKRSGIRRIGLFTTRQISSNGEYGFYDTLRDLLCRKIQDLGLEYTIWFDSRRPEKQSTVPEYISRAVAADQVQAVAGILLGEEAHSWFHRLPVHVTDVSSILMERRDIQSVPEIVRLLKDRNFKRIGIICPENPRTQTAFPLQALQEGGIRLLPRYQRRFSSHRPDYPTFEEYGYRLTADLLDSKPRPEALIVYPDHAARGAILAIRERGIRVPEELFPVFHRNRELEYFCPFPAAWLEVSISTIADLLLENLLGKTTSSSAGNLKGKECAHEN